MLIDSSGARLVCALADEAGQVVAESVLSGDDARRPIDAVVAELRALQPSADLTSIVVGTGPGSFIGTRTAISYANGFAAAAPSVSLYGVNSLAAISAVYGGLPVLRDARRSQWYLWTPDGRCAAYEESGAVEALRAAGASSVIVEVPSEMYAAWQAETKSLVAQAPVPAKDSEAGKGIGTILHNITSPVPSIIHKELPFIKQLHAAGIQITLSPGVTGAGLLAAAVNAEPVAYVEPVYLRGFT